ncbi:chemotaxis protein CheW [Anaerolineales bacterium HSG6]|nr:chemotaxis protein CheW [Anaerolineales bacterium HSG6]
MSVKTPLNGHQPNNQELSSPASMVDDASTINPEKLAKVWAKRAYKLAQSPEVEVVGETIDLLTFRLGMERYAVEVSNVREIYPLQQMTRVPRTPEFVVGVFSARGRILSIIDLAAFLGLPPSIQLENSNIIVVMNNQFDTNQTDIEVGILADEVEDVATIFKKDLRTSLSTHNKTHDYTHGITSDLVEVLNLNSLLTDSRLIVNDDGVS